jgi:hypothetical protein
MGRKGWGIGERERGVMGGAPPRNVGVFEDNVGVEMFGDWLGTRLGGPATHAQAHHADVSRHASTEYADSTPTVPLE